MKTVRFVAALLVACLFCVFASESYGQCGRAAVSQSVQALPQPQVSVFQLPTQPLQASSSAGIAASQAVTVAPQQQFVAPAFVAPQAACASGQCGVRAGRLGRTGILARLIPSRGQTIRQVTVVRN